MIHLREQEHCNYVYILFGMTKLCNCQDVDNGAAILKRDIFYIKYVIYIKSYNKTRVIVLKITWHLALGERAEPHLLSPLRYREQFNLLVGKIVWFLNNINNKGNLLVCRYNTSYLHKMTSPPRNWKINPWFGGLINNNTRETAIKNMSSIKM